MTELIAKSIVINWIKQGGMVRFYNYHSAAWGLKYKIVDIAKDNFTVQFSRTVM
jgi:hypothetical protein